MITFVIPASNSVNYNESKQANKFVVAKKGGAGKDNVLSSILQERFCLICFIYWKNCGDSTSSDRIGKRIKED